jgi:hypothetical protein
MHPRNSASAVTTAAATVLHSCIYSCAAGVVQLTARHVHTERSFAGSDQCVAVSEMCHWRVSAAAVVCCSAALVCSSAGYSCVAVLQRQTTF